MADEKPELGDTPSRNSSGSGASYKPPNIPKGPNSDGPGPDSGGNWVAYVDTVTGAFLAYVFWSLFEVLPSFIFYWSLWDMALTGMEAVFVSSTITAILGISAIYNFVSRFESIFHLGTLIGVLAYQIDEPVHRLTLLSVGYVSGFLVQFMHLTRDYHHVYHMILGMVIHGAIKMAYFTLNPLWPTLRVDPTNAKLILLAIAVVSISLRAQLTNRKLESAKASKLPQLPSVSTPSVLTTGLALGAVLHSAHEFIMEPSTLALWTVLPIPHPNPDPVASGVLMLAVCAVCASLSATVPRVSRFAVSIPGALVGLAGLFVLFQYDSRLGYAGGLVFVAYTVLSCIPLAAQLADLRKAGKLGRTLLVATLWYIVTLLAVIWTFVYNFVPGGEYMRERLDVVWYVTAASFLLNAIVQTANPTSVSKPFPTGSSRVAMKKIAVLSIVAAFAVGGIRLANYSVKSRPPRPYGQEQDRVINVAVWNIHHGIDNRNWASDDRVAKLFDEQEIDVVGFFESSLMRSVDAKRDFSQSVPAHVKRNKSFYYTDSGPNTKAATFGCTVLSKFPIIESRHHLLPSPQGELSCAVSAKLDVWGTPVWFYTAHNGNTENTLDLKLQTTKAAQICKDFGPDGNVIYASYVNTKVDGKLYKILTEQGDLTDIDHSDRERYNLYIMYRNLKRLGYARVTRGILSDTELQMAKFFVPPQTDEERKAVSKDMEPWLFSDDKLGKRFKTKVAEAKVPKHVRFPDEYKKPGVDGHHYHVIVPRYYQ